MFASTAAVSHAETLVKYDFTSSATAVTTTGTNVTTAALARGAGLSSLTLSTTAGNPAKSIFVTSAQVDEAISASSTDFIAFTIAPTAGNVLNLSALTFDYAYTFTTGGSTSNTATYSVRSSLDNFATAVGTFTANAQLTGSNPVWAPASVGLTASTFQQLSVPVTFRIVLADDGSTSGSAQLRLDNLALEGLSATPIPEPSTFAVAAGMGGLCLAVMRRRSRKD